ncbi:MAG TPA: DUF4412 domain-containing protein [Rudaea sp.]|jgi:hypothetical protein|nr:DUF4412 domain-containing protein [Rudaea sp.]
MHVRFALAVAIVGCLASVPAMADFRAEFAVVKGGQSAEMPGMSRLELGGNKMRMDADNVSMLFDTGSGKMVALMHDKHQYMDMQKIVETASAAMAQANAALANLPPEQRAMIEQRMGGKIPGMGAKMDVSVTPTGVRDRVGNYNCEVYRTQVGGEHMEDVCLANVSDAGISGADQATLRRAFEEMKTITEKMSNGMFHSPLNAMPADKFPVRMTRFDNGKVAQVVELKSLTTGGVSAGDFAIPAGYSEADMGSLRRH